MTNTTPLRDHVKHHIELFHNFRSNRNPKVHYKHQIHNNSYTHDDRHNDHHILIQDTILLLFHVLLLLYHLYFEEVPRYHNFYDINQIIHHTNLKSN